jgi:ubiquinone/menaquinone biosynthesis C-methylase UbiE
MSSDQIKQDVREFYNQVGWQMAEGGVYQNASYEDLRPVSQEYIHRCHMRVNRHLKPSGKYLLDAGSGPVQYPEYVTYSKGYDRRVCLDISIVALIEARKRLGEHGLYVVADVANLPFAPDVFDGIVSLHTLHHLPAEDQKKAYRDLNRVLKPGSTAVVVNGWTVSPLMQRSKWLVSLNEDIGRFIARLRGKSTQAPNRKLAAKPQETTASGTYIQKIDAAWVKQVLSQMDGVDVLVWRSVNVRFLRAVIHSATGGKLWLKLLYWMEERWPHYFGEKGQYPLIVIRKNFVGE